MDTFAALDSDELKTGESGGASEPLELNKRAEAQPKPGFHIFHLFAALCVLSIKALLSLCHHFVSLNIPTPAERRRRRSYLRPHGCLQMLHCRTLNKPSRTLVWCWENRCNPPSVWIWFTKSKLPCTPASPIATCKQSEPVFVNGATRAYLLLHKAQEGKRHQGWF